MLRSQLLAGQLCKLVNKQSLKDIFFKSQCMIHISKPSAKFQFMEKGKSNEMTHQDVLSIFSSAVNSVLPHHMINNYLKLSDGGKTLLVEGQNYKLDHNVYVVGFGKAVLGMARSVEDILSQHIVQGIISIPTDCQLHLQEAGKHDMMLSSNSRIEVREGSKNNMPDENSYQSAIQIQDLIAKRKEKDIIIVLISGGGSALLPLPIPPVTLGEEMELTQLMSRNGATIDELNILRKNIEVLKGGGLAKQAKPAKVIAVIMSDVIRDKMDIIASGPTVPDKSTPQQCQIILKRLNLQNKIPETIQNLLSKRAREVSKSSDPLNYTEKSEWEHVNNIIVGSNKKALLAASTKAEQLGYLPIILSSVLDGDAGKVGSMFGMLGRYAALSFGYKSSNTSNSDYSQLEFDLVSSGVPKETLKKVVSLADQAYNSGKPLCLMTGGETTVNVKGTGVGGRNQEMALSCAIELDKQCKLDSSLAADFNITFLSGGTDGIDGPTPVAGAVIDQTLISKCWSKDIDAVTYLQNNDSYNLFKEISEDCLIKIGHTGTNVMDIQVLIVKNR